LIAPYAGHEHPPRWSLEPIITPDPAIGFGATRRIDPAGNTRLQLVAMYGWNDRRRARLTFSSARDTARFGLTASAAYNYRPNTTFFGIGNHTSLHEKSYWLREAGEADAILRYGRPVRHEARLIGTISSVSARSGYNGSPNSQRTSCSTRMSRSSCAGSTVVSYGVAGELAKLDDIRTRVSASTSRARPTSTPASDNSDLDYRRYHVEARAYFPAFSDRQSFALRALHDWVDPSTDSEAIPYYRLPETEGELRFNGYKVHRFSDRHLVLGTLEYRWWLTNKIYSAARGERGRGRLASLGGCAGTTTTSPTAWGSATGTATGWPRVSTSPRVPKPSCSTSRCRTRSDAPHAPCGRFPRAGRLRPRARCARRRTRRSCRPSRSILRPRSTMTASRSRSRPSARSRCTRTRCAKR
jgi:hypothetical protein